MNTINEELNIDGSDEDWNCANRYKNMYEQ